MALFDFLRKKEPQPTIETIKDTSVTTKPEVSSNAQKIYQDWNSFRMIYDIGRITNLYDRTNSHYNPNSYLLAEGGRYFEFDLDINLYCLWKPNVTNDMYPIGMYDACYGESKRCLYKIILGDSDLKGINEIDVKSCIAKFTIESRPSGFSVFFTGNVAVERKAYLLAYETSHQKVDRNGISIDFFQMPVKIKPIQFQISDFSQLSKVFESVKDTIRDAVEDSFRTESNMVKSKLYTQSIAKSYKEKVNEESIRDIFNHVIDILGEPSMVLSSNLYKMDFTVNKSGSHELTLDKKMVDALYEISEATSRIKSLYNKTSVNLSISNGCLMIIISPDTVINKEDIDWIEFDPSTMIGEVGPTISSDIDKWGYGATGSYGGTHSHISYHNYIAENFPNRNHRIYNG